MEDQDNHIQVLIADDEASVRFTMVETLEPLGYSCEEASNGREALEKFQSGRYDLVILDFRMPELNGIEVLREIHRSSPDIPVLLVTAYGSNEMEKEAIREGAYLYLRKPVDIDEFRVVVRRALERRLLKQRLQILSKQMDASLGFDGIIGTTSEMREVFHLLQKIAAEDVTVLVLGESGTGKEMVATAIHRHSRRRNAPFVPINCAAIPEALLESELFGHERGAFTGAHIQKLGKFEQAHGGTLFLDEIGDMDAALQAKMLRVLQDQQFQRVGGNRSIQADVRIIAATNKDLAKEVAKGHFREDLFFRLNVIPIFLPPLRRRMADLPLLIENFVKQANSQYSKNISGISPSVMERLSTYPWPGNIRELQNLITRTVILTQGNQITLGDLPMGFLDTEIQPSTPVPMGDPAPRSTAELTSEMSTGKGGGRSAMEILKRIENGSSLQDAVDEEIWKLEKDIIVAALDRHRWRRGHTADFLGISRRNLLRKMQKFGIN